MPGPGAERLQALQANLVNLSPEQADLVLRAKRYSSEQTAKIIYANKAVISESPQVSSQPSQQTSQKCLQRHQTLVLMCRVYVGSISFELREESIKAAFGIFGAIKSVNMSWDPVTLKHKGFAFVEFELPEAAQLALEHMNGIQLGGRQIKVGRPSNLPQAASIIQQVQQECMERNRLYISNIPAIFTEQDVTSIFEPIGEVTSCKLATHPGVEASRAYGFIELETKEAVDEALQMNAKLEVDGQMVYVCRATTPAENVSAQGTLESENQVSTGPTDEDIQDELERANKEHEMFRLNEQSSLDGGHLHSTSESVSNILGLRNLVSADEDLDDSLMLDVYEECSKHGAISQVVIYVDKKRGTHSGLNNHRGESEADDGKMEVDKNCDSSDQVRIFIKYKDPSESQRAKAALDGRFFGGRRVSAETYDPILFRQRDLSK